MEVEFSGQISEKTPSNTCFIKIRPVGAKLFHEERQTDMTKLIVTFFNFAKSPRNQSADSVSNLTLLLELCKTYYSMQRAKQSVDCKTFGVRKVTTGL